jgi:hypothetical protein
VQDQQFLIVLCPRVVKFRDEFEIQDFLAKLPILVLVAEASLSKPCLQTNRGNNLDLHQIFLDALVRLMERLLQRRLCEVWNQMDHNIHSNLNFFIDTFNSSSKVLASKKRELTS